MGEHRAQRPVRRWPSLGQRAAALGAQVLAPVDARFGGLVVPAWATPMAVALLALLTVQSLDHRYVRGDLAWTLIVTAALTVLLVALFMALARADQRLIPLRRRLVTVGVVVALAVNTLVHMALVVPHLDQVNRYSVDAAASTDCATRMFMHGQNPYRNVHMLTCLHDHGLAFNQTTPKRQGTFWPFLTFVNNAHFENMEWSTYNRELLRERQNPDYASPEFESRFNYPGGAILLARAGMIFGMRDLVAFYLTCAIIASVLIYRSADPRARWITGLLLLADTPLLLDSTVGMTDVLYALLLVIYWHLRQRPILAGLVLGLAAATRQQVWYFAPFLLYLAWRSGGWRDLHRRLWPALAMFVACNLPFLIQSPGDWLAGVLGPVSDPLFAQGVGLIALAIAVSQNFFHSLVLLQWPPLYSILEGLALLVAARYFMRHCLSSPGLAMVLPLMPVALAWRSLHTYFLILPLLATAVLAAPVLGAGRAAPVGVAPEGDLGKAA